ncbi:MAG: helix-turn-helix domain-containing protein [Nitrospinae bacterium]|nr:helix-turn-helix domain-containing protein [Nitrospinota bacterium]MBF0633227.1 helix-turn-helix domain-containing protein [Nitrospinota bacterium]
MIRNAHQLDLHEVLNLHPDAAPEEIERAYLHLTTIYSENSRAVYGALSDEERRWMVKRIQEAYETLMSRAGAVGETRQPAQGKAHPSTSAGEQGKPGGSRAPAQDIAKQQRGSDDSSKQGAERETKAESQLSAKAVTGAHLRNIRIAKGVSLDEISAATKVKKSYLEAIESDNPKRFPAPVFMKGFIKAYAKALGLNPEEISEKYLHREQ